MASRQQIDSAIIAQGISLSETAGDAAELVTILGGEPGNDSSGRATVTYQNKTYQVADIVKQLEALVEEGIVTQATIDRLREQRSLASTNITSSSARAIGDDTVLRDYRHAARIFTDGQYRLSPKYGFLFYVEFEFNPEISQVNSEARKELGMIVKSCGLPKFSIDTKAHNAYNRVNIVQNKIKYDPINITFHDDQGDVVRDFWYDYYSYFYRDPDYADSTYNAPHKYQSRTGVDWGYSPRSGYSGTNKTQPYQYIQSIKIYSLYQKQFSEYQLINPVITNFRHGDHVNGDSNLLEHSMSIQFETVKYLTGYVTENNTGGFVDLHYDHHPSPIAFAHGGRVIPNDMNLFSDIPDTVTDLASSTVLVNKNIPPAIINVSFGDAFSSSFSSATTFATTSSGTGIGGTNFGGMLLPSLGTLTQGVTNSAILGQQLQASAGNLVGGIVNSAANGVIGGLAEGLGQNGGAIVNLAVAAIQNPQALVATATNMAATYAMQQVGSFASDLAQQGINQASGWIKDQTAELISPVTTAFGDVANNLQNVYADISSQFNVASLADVSANDFAAGADTSWFSSDSFD